MTTAGSIDTRELADEITTRLCALSRQTTVPMRAVRREFSRRLANAAPEEVIRLAGQLLDRYRWVAYELVHHHAGALGLLGAKELQRFARGNDNWGAVDAFACYLAGPAWRNRQVSDTVIRRWARSPDRWQRRAALVSTVPLNNKSRGGTGDTPRTLQICRLLAGDREAMVMKALSWALRELAKRDPQAVRTFLSLHSEVLAARVKREVTNKLATVLKNPRRAQRRSLY